MEGNTLLPIEQQPDLSNFLRLLDEQHSEEPNLNPWKKYKVSDQFGEVLYDSGCAYNVENTLQRFVHPQLYPLELTELVPQRLGCYTVPTCTGPVAVTGYGLAEATVPYPDGRFGKVAYLAFYAPSARESIRTRFSAATFGISIKTADLVLPAAPQDQLQPDTTQLAEGAGLTANWWTKQIKLTTSDELLAVTNEIEVREAVRDFLYNVITDCLVWEQGRKRALENPSVAAKLMADQEAFLAAQ